MQTSKPLLKTLKDFNGYKITKCRNGMVAFYEAYDKWLNVTMTFSSLELLKATLKDKPAGETR
jgi:hypothetical protein